MRHVVITDLDGVLLDYDYSFAHAKEAISALKEKKVPLVFCTSKTTAEVKHLQTLMGVNWPCIVENGGAIVFPAVTGRAPLILGENSDELKLVLKEIQDSTGIGVELLSEMPLKRLMEVTGLKEDDAKRAQDRDYSEPFLCSDEKIVDHIKESGFECVLGGRFYYLMGKTSKGKAVYRLLKEMEKMHGPIHSFGFGDSPIDISLLDAVDTPFSVGTLEYNAEHIDSGSKAWNDKVLSLLPNLVGF